MVDVGASYPNPSGDDRRPARRSRLRADNSFSLALIAAATILGAGIFKLPSEVARVGWVPVLVLGAITWVLSRRAYRRQADVAVETGAASYGDTIASVGSDGAAGAARQLGLFGAFAYIAPSLLGYTTLGAGVASWAADGVRGHSGVIVSLLATGIGLCLVSTRPLVLSGRIRLAGVWSAGIGAVALVPSGLWASAAAGTVFVTGALVATGRRKASDPASEEEPPDKLELDPGHEVSAFNLFFFQVPLMMLLGALAVYVVASTGAPWQAPSAFGGTSGDLLIAFGTLMFAAVGSFTPLAGYPAMRDRGYSHKVVDGAMRFILVLKVVWITLVVLSVSGKVLLAHSGDNRTSAQVMAGLVSEWGPSWMGALAAATAVLAFGIGLTGAGAGFSETLAIEMRSAQTHRVRGKARDALSMQRWIIVGCALLTPIVGLGFHGLADAVLAIGGILGGAVMVNITGAIAEVGAARRSRAAIEARTCAVFAGLLTVLLVAHTVEPAYRDAGLVLAGVAASYLCWLTVLATADPARVTSGRGAVALITTAPVIAALVVMSV